MLGLVMAAGLGVGNRPAQIVKPGEEAAYVAWLDGQMRTVAGSFAGKDCAKAPIQSILAGPLEDVIVRQHPEIYFWLEAAQIRDCGPAQAQQLVVIRNGDKWRAIPMAPGLSAAGPTLEKDIVNNVAQGAAILARKADPTCVGAAIQTSFRLVNTAVVGTRTNGAPWSEVWTVHACKDDYSLTVGLSPAKDGGTDIRVSLPGTKPTP